MGIEVFDDVTLQRVIDHHEHDLAEAKAEKARREAKTYGQREAERMIVERGNCCELCEPDGIRNWHFGAARAGAVREVVAKVIDAARRDAFEQAAKAVEEMPCHVTVTGAAVLVRNAAFEIRQLK